MLKWMRGFIPLTALALGALLTACMTKPTAAALASLPPGARYVAMGSSYAAGPGITTPADVPPNRCARSNDNYAHMFARKHRLQLVDVSCSGATTAHVLGSWRELPAQIDSVTADVRLVTLTIGGNDVGYMGSFQVARCAAAQMPPSAVSCPSTLGAPPVVTEDRWATLQAALERITDEVHHRAPKARLVFVQYLSVLPERNLCADLPLSEGGANAARAIADRLAQVTALAAAHKQAALVPAYDLSRGHDACSETPWTAGYERPGGPPVAVALHPNLAGMASIAAALESVR
jgi:lysophospholipase L1-like esterase